MTRTKTRVLVIDDHPKMRHALETLLSSDSHCDVVTSIPNDDFAIRRIAASCPDIVLISLGYACVTDLATIGRIKRACPAVKIIALAYERDERYVEAATAAGADGYVLKQDRRSEVLSSIASVVAGRAYLSDGLRNSALPCRSAGIPE